MNRRNVAAAAAATVALTVLTGCMSDPDTAGVAKSEPVLVDDATDGADDGEAWCEKAVAKAVENLDDAKDAPKASTFEGHRLTSPDAETRVCTWRAVVGADGNVALVEDWKASFAADADGKWKLVDAALVTDDEQHVAGQGPEFAAVDAIGQLVAHVADKPSKAPATLAQARKDKKVSAAVAGPLRLAAYRFDGLDDFEICVVDPREKAWAKATPAVTEFGEGVDGCTA